MATSFVQLELRVEGPLVDQLVALLAQLGFEGFWEDGPVLRCYISGKRWSEDMEQEIARMIRLLVPAGTYRIPELHVQRVADQDWNEQWERSIQPIHLTPDVVVAPTWQEYDPEPGTMLLRIDPKMAFGTGYHESTRLAGALLRAYLVPQSQVLDLGTGTGILSILAAKSGAGHVVAVDIDEWSYRNATENARLNNCEKSITIMQGGIEVVPPGRFGMILANIQLTVIAGLLSECSARLDQGGTLILSGLLASESGEIRELLNRAGFRILEERLENDWLGVAAAESRS